MKNKKFEKFKSICQPVKKINTDSLIGRLFYRKFSIYFTYFSIHLGLSANTLSLIGLVIAIVGILLFSIILNIRMSFISIILLQISVFLDYSDGEVARYRKYESKRNEGQNNISGAFMDNMGHKIIGPMAIFFFSYRHACYFSDWLLPILILGFLAAIAGIGIPNLVMSSIIVNAVQVNAKVLDNSKFRTIIFGHIHVFLEKSKYMSWFKKILLIVANLYKGISIINIVSFLILIELLLTGIGYNIMGRYIGLGGFVLFTILLIFNFIRTFRRNFLYLDRSF